MCISLFVIFSPSSVVVCISNCNKKCLLQICTISFRHKIYYCMLHYRNPIKRSLRILIFTTVRTEHNQYPSKRYTIHVGCTTIRKSVSVDVHVLISLFGKKQFHAKSITTFHCHHKYIDVCMGDQLKDKKLKVLFPIVRKAAAYYAIV